MVYIDRVISTRQQPKSCQELLYCTRGSGDHAQDNNTAPTLFARPLLHDTGPRENGVRARKREMELSGRAAGKQIWIS